MRLPSLIIKERRYAVTKLEVVLFEEPGLLAQYKSLKIKQDFICTWAEEEYKYDFQ